MKYTALLGVLFVFLPASNASADEFHYENLRYGQRALGMSGAVIAEHGEPETTFYNPAGLGFLTGAIFSGTLHFFGIDERNLVDGFQIPDFEPATITSDGFVALPSSSVITYPFEGGQHVVAFTTLLRSESALSFDKTQSRAFLTNTTQHDLSISLSHHTTDTMLFMGPTYAYRPLQAFGLGISIFLTQRNQTSDIQSGFEDPQTDANTGSPLRTTFGDTFSSTTLTDWGILARIGVLAQLGDVHIGLTATTPSLHIWGCGDIRYGVSDSGDPGATDPARVEPSKETFAENELEARTLHPWNFGLGLSYTLPGAFTIAASTSIYLPSTYQRLPLTDAQEAFISAHLINTIERELVVNAAVGLELFLSESWMVRSGFFTNLSAAPDIPQNPARTYASDVDLFGTSLSVGYLGDLGALNIGTEFQWGSGHDVVRADATRVWAPEFLRVERDEFRAVFFVSGAVEFVEATTVLLFDDDDDE